MTARRPRAGRRWRFARRWSWAGVGVLFVLAWAGNHWWYVTVRSGTSAPYVVMGLVGGCVRFDHVRSSDPRAIDGTPVGLWVTAVPDRFRTSSMWYWRVRWTDNPRAIPPAVVVQVPYWMFAVTLAAPSVFWSLRDCRRRRRGLCAVCGYPRAGLAPDVPCPECGAGPARPAATESAP